MISRIVDISTPCFLSVKHQQLVIERDGDKVGSVPIEDLGVLILDNHSLVYTQQVMMACAEANVAVIVCNDKHMPVSMFVPFDANSLHTKTLNAQISATEPIKKRMWQQIVQAKVGEQAKLAKNVKPRVQKLAKLKDAVKSGDPDNIEGLAARMYFEILFGEGFKRDREEPGINTLLNYGYIVLRACVSRAVVGAGLHPAIGVHHKNQYNAYCLADDLIEPLRPLVDSHIVAIFQAQGKDVALDPPTKRTILRFLDTNVQYDGREVPLMTALHYYAASARKVLSGEARKLVIPSLSAEIPSDSAVVIDREK